jgi:DNA-directed RNA polymerase specialized sigma24 family protein
VPSWKLVALTGAELNAYHRSAIKSGVRRGLDSDESCSVANLAIGIALHTHRPERGSVLKWVRRKIARALRNEDDKLHRRRDHQRWEKTGLIFVAEPTDDQGRRNSRIAYEPRSREPGPVERAIIAESRIPVAEAMHLMGFTQAEIADYFGTSTATQHRHVQRATMWFDPAARSFLWQIPCWTPQTENHVNLHLNILPSNYHIPWAFVPPPIIANLFKQLNSCLPDFPHFPPSPPFIETQERAAPHIDSIRRIAELRSHAIILSDND